MRSHLGGDGGDDGLGVDEGGVAKVVETVSTEDLRARLEPNRLLELHAPVLLLWQTTHEHLSGRLKSDNAVQSRQAPLSGKSFR